MIVVLTVPASEVTAEGTYQELKSLAARGIRHRMPEVRPPEITVENGVMTAFLGSVEWRPIDEDSSLGGSLLQAQLEIELIRQFRSASNQQRNWRPYLEETDAIVREAFEMPRRDELEQEDALQVGARVSEVLGRGCREIPERHGLECRFQALVYKFAVQVRTDPAGASIWMMHALEPALAEIEGRDPVWERLVQTDMVPLAGKYWYYLRWPSGVTSGSELMAVSSTAEVVLR